MYNSVVALLQLALSLLIAAQQPNVPENLKIQAIQTANYAISYAQSELHTPVASNAKTEPTVVVPEQSAWIKLTTEGKGDVVEKTSNSFCQENATWAKVPCRRSTVEWDTKGYAACGFQILEGIGIGDAGNLGLRGTHTAEFLQGKTLLRLSCDGIFSKDLEVNVI